jgi:nitrate reductase delta subunit
VSPAHTRLRSAQGALAELLAYPGAGTAAALDRALRDAPEVARAPLSRFAAWHAATPAAAREEAYSASFDLDPKAPPYVGHQLCGESSVRGAFLARLAQVYATGGFRRGGELPDHLSEVLRFLAEADGLERDELLRDGALVALERMLDGIDRADPHRDLLLAARGVLAADPGAERPPAEPPRRRLEVSP